jgi:DNA-binding NtrC family response regulator
LQSLISPPGNIAGPTALIVDLEARSLYEISKAFREVGYRTFGATSFADAKRMLIAEQPSILVADVRLGEFNGIQLLMLARELTPGITAVITNPFVDSVLAEETRRLGGTFMVKPIDSRHLLNTIQVAADPNRRPDRRRTFTPGFTPDRRVNDDRRAITPLERRLGDRRKVLIPNFAPDRRSAARRREMG